MWYNIFVMAIFHAEALWDNTELSKAQALVKMQSMNIGGHNGIELEDTETQFGSCFQ